MHHFSTPTSPDELDYRRKAQYHHRSRLLDINRQIEDPEPKTPVHRLFMLHCQAIESALILRRTSWDQKSALAAVPVYDEAVAAYHSFVETHYHDYSLDIAHRDHLARILDHRDLTASWDPNGVPHFDYRQFLRQPEAPEPYDPDFHTPDWLGDLHTHCCETGRRHGLGAITAGNLDDDADYYRALIRLEAFIQDANADRYYRGFDPNCSTDLSRQWAEYCEESETH